MLLLEQFENLTLHPKNAARLKELVLQLAVQGKLTENWRRQNPDVESAAELLRRIEAEKAQLVKDKKIKKDKPLEPISEDEVPYSLPEGWVWIRLGGLGSIVGGGTPKADSPEFFCEEGIPWLTPADLGKHQGKYVTRGRRDITELGLAKSSAQLLPTGSVLFSSRAPIGHLAIASNPISTNQGFKSCVPYILDLNQYIFYFLKKAAKEINENASGTTFKEVSGKEVSAILVPLPPLAEQKAIVARVEELMQKIEELENQTAERIQLKKHLGAAALQQLTAATDEELEQNWLFLKQHFTSMFDEAANVKKLRETILQLAVQGKLTATWRKYNPTTEPASELLKRIQAEKAQLVKEKKIKKEKPLEPISEDEVPYTLPEGWVWCRFGDVAKEMAYGTSEKTNDFSEVPVLRMGNITSDGKVLYHNLKFISPTIKDLPRLYLKKYDLVFNRTNSYELVGKSGVFDKNDDEFTLASYLIKATLFLDDVDVFYINNYINSSVCRQTQIEPQITQQTNQANFSGSKLKDILVPLPPHTEQEAIVAKVDQLMQLCDKLEKQIQQSKQEAEALMQSVVQEALQVQEEEVIL
ncbi:restriction endonuclease subunit S [Pontibacter lucknowensis]|uniref:Type I restriction enzyme, S subunit n=1 Tax=Pontibacter lucknowensis TaxID=1077936 RepID=A0A1N6XBA8_9BACT|nr:restriction endonuclease subunit S [Pontibacter lucknowensis]SIQ99540.1 type I restriction enzyme, S subunit [Pontibacter lucknowensis]